jgi:hypothetical protein
LSPAQEASWLGLMELYDRLPDQWTLIGGQLVHLHCAERSYAPRRPTPDIDTVLDLRANPQILLHFTQALLDIGFTSAGVTAEDKQHRFIRGEASIDVVIPHNIGERLPRRKGATGSETLQTPGGLQALARSQTIDVTIAGHRGHVRRPNLVGALIVKAAAHTVPSDGHKGRRRSDFATLAAMVSRHDFATETLTRHERRYLQTMTAAVLADAAAIDSQQDIEDGLHRLDMLSSLPGLSSSGRLRLNKLI